MDYSEGVMQITSTIAHFKDWVNKDKKFLLFVLADCYFTLQEHVFVILMKQQMKNIIPHCWLIYKLNYVICEYHVSPLAVYVM